MTVTVSAPAKLNLTLEVLAKREDGYHEISSVIQTIDLCDRLTFSADEDVIIRSDMPGWDAGKSLVSTAVDIFRDTAGCKKGVSIGIEKKIPLSAGLGGDSSDAAAALKGLNRFWETNLPEEMLHRMAERLGSDVPFFLYGGTALIEGRGEKVTPLPPVPPMLFVLVNPPVESIQGKTGKLFGSLTRNHYTDGEITRRFVNALKTGGGLPPLFNTFENVAYDCFPGLDVSRGHFIKLGADAVHLAGSGPVLFTVVKNESAADELFIQLDIQRMNPVIARTLNITEYNG